MSQPQALSRREVLQTAALLGVGGLGLPAAAAAEGLPFAQGSGLVTGKPKPLNLAA